MHIIDIERFGKLTARAKHIGLSLVEATDPHDGSKRFRLTGKTGLLEESSNLGLIETSIRLYEQQV